MIKYVTSAVAVLGIAALIAVYAGLGIASEKESEPGYVTLFNGRSLEGWVIENNGQFAANRGLLVVNKGTGWLRSEKEYADFVFKLDFRFLEKEANSGIFVRTGPTSKKDDNGWPDNGYQVQCMDTISGAVPLGAMIPYGAPPFQSESDLEKLAEAYRPTGEWNTYEITCIGEKLSVKLNGALITKATNIKNLRGRLGIQAEHGRLEFRNLRIKIVDPAIAGAAGISVGQKAPSFSLKDQQNQEHTLEEFLKDGNVALVFYRSADW